MQGPRFAQEFVARMDELRLMPLYELLEELLHCSTWAHRKTGRLLFSFFDGGDRVPAKNNSSVPRTVSSLLGRDALQQNIPMRRNGRHTIFSIHKSKGLEFHTRDSSLFCDWKTGERNIQPTGSVAHRPRSAVQCHRPCTLSTTRPQWRNPVYTARLPQRASAVVGG